jgi:hypothetical protein
MKKFIFLLSLTIVLYSQTKPEINSNDEYKVFKNIFHKIEHNNNIVNLINFDENELSFIKNNSVFREFLNEKIAIII